MRGEILNADLASLLFLLKHVNIWFKLCPKAGLADWFVKRHLVRFWEKHLVAYRSRYTVGVVREPFTAKENGCLNLYRVRFYRELGIFVFRVMTTRFLSHSKWPFRKQIRYIRLQLAFLWKRIEFEIWVGCILLRLSLFALQVLKQLRDDTVLLGLRRHVLDQSEFPIAFKQSFNRWTQT
jgi:hypothetical protein